MIRHEKTQGPSAKPSRQAGAADRDGVQGANRSDSRSYREDLQCGRPPESADVRGATGFAEGPQRTLRYPAVRAQRSRQTIGPASHKPREPVWLFDLDNTLHNTSHAIFPAINLGMTAAVQEALDCDAQTANQLRSRYWMRYGATVIGMERHHGVDPDAFLHRSHDFDVTPLIRADKGLAWRLKRLPGRKVLVTNAPLHYARAVLKHLGILHVFDSLWALEQMRYHGVFRPKPSPALLRHLLAREGIAPARAVLVEDTLPNLRGARQAGLRTVHIFHPGTPFATQKKGRSLYVDLRVNSLTDLLLRRRPLRGRVR